MVSDRGVIKKRQTKTKKECNDSIGKIENHK